MRASVSYINGGAICGNWWKGAQEGCPEGLMVLDLSRDGQIAADYRSYGWNAGCLKKEATPEPRGARQGTRSPVIRVSPSDGLLGRGALEGR
jgi:hypothetical protein